MTEPPIMAPWWSTIWEQPPHRPTPCKWKMRSALCSSRNNVEGLPAPLDLSPKQQTVEFSGLKPGASRVLIFRLDPESKIEEVTRENNSVRKNLLKEPKAGGKDRKV